MSYDFPATAYDRWRTTPDDERWPSVEDEDEAADEADGFADECDDDQGAAGEADC